MISNKLILTLFSFGLAGNGLGSFCNSMQWSFSKYVFIFSAVIIILAFLLMIIKLLTSKKFKKAIKEQS